MDDSDDSFSDDGFDFLPSGALAQLEEDAFRATQALRAQNSCDAVLQPLQLSVPSPGHAVTDLQGLDHPPLPDSVVNQHSLIPSQNQTSEYEDLDLGELDAQVLQDDHVSESGIDHPQFGDDRISTNQEGRMEGILPPRPLAWHQQSVPQDEAVDEVYRGGDGYIASQQATTGLQEMEDLQAQIQKLVRTNQQLMEELNDARFKADTKAGEVLIIRANQAKQLRDYDCQVASLRKTVTDEAEKYKVNIEAARAESKMIETENRFLKQDLAEETRRLNNLKVKSKTEEKGQPATPKKPKALPLRDGFEDDEIAAVSPSKSLSSGQKRDTPTPSGKRKRKASQDSPISMAALELSQVKDVSGGEALLPAITDSIGDDFAPRPIPTLEDSNLRYIKWILNHCTPPNEERDLEVMSTYAFPSEPNQTFSSVVLKETAGLRTGNYPLEYASVIISLWSRALDEKYYTPIYLFMGIVKFILLLDTTSFAPKLIEPLAPALQRTGEVNGVPRFRHSPVSSQNYGQVKPTPRSELHYKVDSTEALDVLYLLATGCLGDGHQMKAFWGQIRFDFVLAMLNCSQLLNDITLTLDLLTLSIRLDSFGPIQETKEGQQAVENYIIDRVANLFGEKPQVDEGQDPCAPLQICEMRLHALSFLEAIVFSAPNPDNNHGSSVVATRPTALARLIRSMHDELDALYSYTPEPEHELHTALVNGLMNLIYGIINNHGGDVDLPSKLARVDGGSQKFLVVLTRLACCEDSVHQAGITEATIEMAHEILDGAVNPQEAEALLEVFPREDS